MLGNTREVLWHWHHAVFSLASLLNPLVATGHDEVIHQHLPLTFHESLRAIPSCLCKLGVLLHAAGSILEFRPLSCPRYAYTLNYFAVACMPTLSLAG